MKLNSAKNATIQGRKMSGYILRFGLLLFFFNNIFFAQDNQVNYGVLSDSVFQSFKLEDVNAIKDRFNRRKDNATQALDRISESSLKMDSSIINRKENTSVGQDAVLLRLAEFYYEQAEDRFFQENIAYDKKYNEYDSLLTLYDAGKISVLPKEPQLAKRDYSKTISVYRRIADDFPNGSYADEALYNIGFLFSQMAEESKSRRIFQELLDKYPDSKYAADAYLYLADYFFNPRDNKTIDQSILELEKAIKLYKKILRYNNSKAYNEALYKLGWSYYKLTGNDSVYFKDAIWYFWRAIEDIALGRKYDPTGEITSSNIEPEAIKYIAICYTDARYPGRGVANARKFIENIESKLGERDYNVLILRNLGNVYFEREDRINAILSYETLLEMYPLYSDAPLISKKIVDTYMQEGQSLDAYKERERLYINYNPDSEWYKKIENSQSRDKFTKLKQAYKLSEEALRGNVAYDFIEAEDKYSDQVGQGHYTKVADEIYKYLKIFPIDTNAYELNWQLAQILDYKERKLNNAFDEYLKVCNDYYEEKYQEGAAKAAISVAQEMAGGKVASDTTKGAEKAFDEEALRAKELSEDQQRLIYSYDNYLRHFPEGDYAPTALASAGALYFNNNQFSQAKVYLQTLIQKFPGADERNLAYKSIMESYFALGKFRDAEIVANKIINTPGVSDKLKGEAKSRASASIFKNAEKLSREKKFLESGDEFKRLTTTYPESKFADISMLRSASSYEEGNSWKMAINSYHYLIENYPKSKYVKDSYINIAEDYKELDDNKAVAESYETLFTVYPKEERAEGWLYNSSLFFEKAKSWEDAIRVNNQYVANYPASPDANLLLFNNAGYYLKLNRLEDANRIYDEFARKYPNSPRTVEAFYKRGEYFKDNGQIDLAMVEFNKAVQKSDQLKAKGKDPNGFFAGEAVFQMLLVRRKEFDSIKLSYADYELKRTQKIDLLKRLQKDYQRVISYGSVRGFESFYRIPEMYEVIGDDIKNQEIPVSMAADKALIKRRDNRAAAAQLYQKAVDEYKNILEFIPGYGKKLGIDIFARPKTEEQVVDSGFAAVDSSALKRAVLEDSTRITGHLWYSRSEKKISMLMYYMAEAHKENMDEMLLAGYSQAEQVAGPLNIYVKITLLIKAVIPSALKAIQAHEQNVALANELQLDNKYVEESKRQILLVSNVAAEKFSDLFDNSLQGHFKNEKKVLELSNESSDFADEDGKYLGDYVEESKKYLDYAKVLGSKTLAQYVNTLDLAAQDSIVNDYLKTTQNKMFEFAYLRGSETHALSAKYDTLNKAFIAKFDTSDFNYVFEDAGYYFEDIRFAMEDIYRNLLETGYATGQDLQVESIWTKRILGELVMIDPATYASQVPKEKLTLTSGDKFLATDEYFEGWPGRSFVDSTWQQARVVEMYQDSVKFPLFTKLGISPKPIWTQLKAPVMKEMFLPDTVWNNKTAGDSLSTDGNVVDSPETAAADSSQGFLGNMLNTLDSNQVQPDSIPDYTIKYISKMVSVEVDTVDTVDVEFRVHFDLPGKPTTGIIYLTADDDYQLFLNGEYIYDDVLNDYSVVDSIAFYTFGDFLVSGENVIGIKVEDIDNSPRLGLRFYMEIQYIPKSLQEQLARDEKIEDVYVEPKRLHRVMLVQKGRLTTEN